ncbi:hypothetical protein MAXJ12_26378 [Mesorhizobium alhagi CCNWXJ12-2]|uniref:Uncharacterized protein n=1 Tax=Mesorhizobium alhagi CCNWXJ12-2 TaxID=1107882 RepID=H0HYJ5_9HYPH|nr:hypothetical protein MAXJ12_26378 [Mesorhizobium alhagi CCNWXJ12-2]
MAGDVTARDAVIFCRVGLMAAVRSILATAQQQTLSTKSCRSTFIVTSSLDNLAEALTPVAV